MYIKNSNMKFLLGSGLVLVMMAALMLAGCGSSSTPPAKAGDANASVAKMQEKGGAELWGQTCARCHNIRPPTEFSHDQWQVAMHHMRIRGYLTGEEQKKILEFLKSAD